MYYGTGWDGMVVGTGHGAAAEALRANWQYINLSDQGVGICSIDTRQAGRQAEAVTAFSCQY